MRNFHSTFTRQPYEITPLACPEAIDLNNPHAIAETLMDTEPYQVYLHMDQFCWAEVYAMALEEASGQVASRAQLQQAASAIAIAGAGEHIQQPIESMLLLSWK